MLDSFGVGKTRNDENLLEYKDVNDWLSDLSKIAQSASTTLNNQDFNSIKNNVNVNTDKESGPYVSHNISFIDNIITNDDFILNL